MSAKTAVLLSLSLSFLGSAILAAPSARKIAAGQIYKSPNHIFTVVVPKRTDFEGGGGWEVTYESTKGNHEMVTFAIYDFGETYRAGVVEIGRTAVDLDDIAHDVAVSRQHQIGVPFDFVEETKVNTQFGEGSLRIYSMKGGSLVMSGRGFQKAEFHDSYIAVLLVPQESRTLFAVAQDDNLGLVQKAPDESWKKSIRDEVQAFFATMALGN